MEPDERRYSGNAPVDWPSPAATTVFDRARADIDSGRLWKARDRLTAAFKHDPADQRLLALLGEVYFEMGDLPNAGRLWILTARTGADVDAALSAFEERWGRNLGEKLKMVPINGTIDDYPALAQERIRALRDEAHRNDIDWQPRDEHQSPEAYELLDDEPMTWAGWLFGGLIVILGPGLWLLGIAAAIYLLANWLIT